MDLYLTTKNQVIDTLFGYRGPNEIESITKYFVGCKYYLLKLCEFLVFQFSKKEKKIRYNLSNEAQTLPNSYSNITLNCSATIILFILKSI